MSAPGTVALLLSQSLPSGPESDSEGRSWRAVASSLVEESGRDLRSVSICDRVCVREEKEEGRSRVEGLLDRVGLNYRHVREIYRSFLSPLSPLLSGLDTLADCSKIISLTDHEEIASWSRKSK
jgi:hypothetical protein